MITEGRRHLVAQVRGALRDVIDSELGHNVVDLDLSVEQGAAGVTTTMGCPVGGSLEEGVANWALLVQGIETADVILTFDPPWRPAMIKPDVKALLGFSEVS